MQFGSRNINKLSLRNTQLACALSIKLASPVSFPTFYNDNGMLDSKTY